ncbi:hypothetical protein J6590_006170 [Homalodisca vitripennis]|nr:hypothetical protein J6590_006170 [Homalodisca vitripennis]
MSGDQYRATHQLTARRAARHGEASRSMADQRTTQRASRSGSAFLGEIAWRGLVSGNSRANDLLVSHATPHHPSSPSPTASFLVGVKSPLWIPQFIRHILIDITYYCFPANEGVPVSPVQSRS